MRVDWQSGLLTHREWHSSETGQEEVYLDVLKADTELLGGWEYWRAMST